VGQVDANMPEEALIYEKLKEIYDPEVGINIVDMGLIYSLDIADSKVEITMTLTSPGCPAGPQILSQIDSQVKTVAGIDDVDINVVWSPPWSPDMLSEEARDQLGIF
jgi:metal-sulfur cluster biosynthetic enzyme